MKSTRQVAGVGIANCSCIFIENLKFHKVSEQHDWGSFPSRDLRCDNTDRTRVLVLLFRLTGIGIFFHEKRLVSAFRETSAD